MGQIDVSVVIPVYRNADTLVQLTYEIHQQLGRVDAKTEIVFVDDQSPDNAGQVLADISREFTGIKVLRNRENIGQQGAIRRGLRVCDGDAVIVMDADLQDPTSAIPLLLLHLHEQECDAVFAARVGRYQSGLRMLSSVIYRAVFCRMAGLPRGAGGYVIMTRLICQKLSESKNPRFHLAGLIGHYAPHIESIAVRRNFRDAGTTAYSHRMRLNTAISNTICILSERYKHGTG